MTCAALEYSSVSLSKQESTGLHPVQTDAIDHQRFVAPEASDAPPLDDHAPVAGLTCLDMVVTWHKVNPG